MIEMVKTEEEKRDERNVVLAFFIIFTAILPLSLGGVIYSMLHYDIFMSGFRVFVLIANLAGWFGALYYYITSGQGCYEIRDTLWELDSFFNIFKKDMATTFSMWIRLKYLQIWCYFHPLKWNDSEHN